MIHVYVETNFVLELVLRQEQADSCEELLRLGETGQIQLVVPAFSLVEPHETLVRRQRNRKRVKEDLDRELGQLRRTSTLSSRLGSFRDLTALLVESADEESKRLDLVRSRILSSAEVIPLGSAGLELIARYQSRHDFSPQDAVVYASVISHLKDDAPAESYFLNRDSKDFDDPAIAEELQERSCTWIPRFDRGLERIRARVASRHERPT